MNIKKADWPGFAAEVESKLADASPPEDLCKGESFLRRAIRKAAKHNIPMGRIPFMRPQLSPEAARLDKERDRLAHR